MDIILKLAELGKQSLYVPAVRRESVSCKCDTALSRAEIMHLLSTLVDFLDRIELSDSLPTTETAKQKNNNLEVLP